MRKLLFLSCLGTTLMFGPVLAAEPVLQISYPTDGAMTCEQMNAEVARMDQIVATSNQAAGGAQGAATAANLGATVAIEGALRTGVLGRVPGLGMFANGAANLARQNAEAKQKAAEETIRTATTRRALMTGLYQGKNCAAAPAAAPAATPAAAPIAAPAG